MNLIKKNNLLLPIFIVLLAVVLRFYQIDKIPPSLTWDEVSLGYNAYSIGQTFRDEHGRFLPYDYFAAFGDYKPPFYIYADVLPIKIFGLNEFAVRFPSALAGVLTVLVTYFLVMEMFGRQSIALLTAFILAISPWHTQLSRAAFEANVATFLIILGVFFLFKGLKNPLLFILAIISLVASVYTFNSARIVAPLLLVGFLIIFLPKILAAKKWVVLMGLLGVVLVTPLLPHLLSKEGRLRFQEVNIFTDLNTVRKANERIAIDKNAWWANFAHNRRVSFTLLYLQHYFDHFNPEFLFIKGDGNPKFSLQDVGEFYLWEIPFLFAGTYFLLKQRKRATIFIIYWLLVAIVPAATARETPHALRIENSLPTWQLIIAFGVLGLGTNVKKTNKIWGASFVVILGLAVIFNLYFYLHNYFSHYPREFSREWQYGYKEAISYVSKIEAGYDQVVVTEALGRPYIYFLFYEKYDPGKFWQNSQVERDYWGFYHVSSFDKYYFGGSNLQQVGKRVLYVSSPSDVPKEAKILKTINLLNGEPILVIHE